MTRSLLRALMFAATVASAAPVAAQTLAERLDARLDAPGLDRLFWGVSITDLNGTPLYGRNAERLFVPASNTKLVVSVTASALLGPNFTVNTSVFGAGAIVNGVLQGNLVLYGRGDPTFSKHCYDQDTTKTGVCDRDPATKLRDLARQLRARGITSIAGDLVGDGSYFTPDLIHPNWQNYDLGWWYAAPVSGLGFNDNSFDVREFPGDSVGARPLVSLSPDFGGVTVDNQARVAAPGSRRTFDLFRSSDGTVYKATGEYPAGSPERMEYAAVLDPNQFAALALRRELLAEGIIVRGRVRSTLDSMEFAAARAAVPLAEVRSRPLKDWIFPILSTSQNWFAEMTLKQLGKRFGAAGSWEEGRKVERRFLIDSVGVDSTQFAVEDGSGLAANNLVSPLAFTRMLTFIRHHPNYAMIQAALPLSGKPGTLRQRFTGTPLEGRVRAKTGTISRVNTLSGFVEREDGSVVVFSVLANHHTLTSARMLAAIDAVVLELARP